MAKLWQVLHDFTEQSPDTSETAVVDEILKNRGIRTLKERELFFDPPDPHALTAKDVGIDTLALRNVIERLLKALKNRESVVVYADYDADGITAGAVMWETLWKLGARVMPYIPHRVDEGYGLSQKGIDAVREQFDPSLIITVDHGITAHAMVSYAQKLGIEVIVTDHHVKPDVIPACLTVHTTELSGSGVSWFVAKELMKAVKKSEPDLVALPAIGTIADLLPLIGVNRAIVKYGLASIRKSKRVGLNALIAEAGIEKPAIDTFSVSHMLSPRLNAMGRLEHALDALRLLCTNDGSKAALLAQKLGVTNKERQQLTIDTVMHAKDLVPKKLRKLIFIAHESYNPGVIGLVAGRLVEEYYRPSVVLSLGDGFAKASARSIPGFNIVEAIRSCSELLVDVGGHPMAAGFTVETKNVEKLKKKLESIAETSLGEEDLVRAMKVDAEIPAKLISERMWSMLQKLQPYGFGNPEPVFASRNLSVSDIRIIGATKKHLKLKFAVPDTSAVFEAVAFNMADLYGALPKGTRVDLAYTIDMNEWNGRRSLQLKVKDIVFPGDVLPKK